MTEEQKKYIEDNIELIETNKWDEFFQSALPGIGAVLYAAGINFMSEMKRVPPKCFEDSVINSVTIPDSVTSIGNDAFYGCKSLTSIIIPDSVTSIGTRAFRHCPGVSSVCIGKGVIEVGVEAFFNCFGLCTISIHNPKTYFKKVSIDTTNLTDIDYRGTCDEFRKYFNLNALNDDGGTIEINCSDGTLRVKYFPEVKEYRFVI